MSAPHIRPARQAHRECWKQAWPLSRHEHRLGDVRRCEHGKIQVLVNVPAGAPVQGPGTWWWHTISPILEPFKYRRARRALDAS